MALTDNIWGYWKLDGNITDSTGQRSPSLSGTLSYPSGKINQCAQFNATQNINTGSYININSSEWTVNFWANLSDSSSALDNVFTQGNSAETQLNTINFNTSGFRFLSRNSGDQNVTAAVNYYDSTWRMFTVKKTGTGSTGTIQIKVNNVTVASGTITNLANRTLKHMIGQMGDSTSSSYRYRNKLDEIGVWNRALSDAEISELYNGGAGLSYPFTPIFNPALGRRRLI